MAEITKKDLVLVEIRNLQTAIRDLERLNEDSQHFTLGSVDTMGQESNVALPLVVGDAVYKATIGHIADRIKNLEYILNKGE